MYEWKDYSFRKSSLLIFDPNAHNTNMTLKVNLCPQFEIDRAILTLFLF